jgi:hypothetical protein
MKTAHYDQIYRIEAEANDTLAIYAGLSGVMLHDTTYATTGE